MIYTLENTVGVGRPVKDVIDANGVHYPMVVECDTETGRMIIREAPDYGRKEIQAAAPLTVIFK